MNKNGESIVLEEVIFFVLNVIFFGIFLFFMINASSNSFVLEQYYAKQIALFIDSAEPGTLISIDVSDAYEIAEKNNVNFGNVFRIENGEVVVQLSNSRSYGFSFFNDVKVAESNDKDGRLNLFIFENE